MTQALQRRERGDVSRDQWQILIEQADILHRSGFLPKEVKTKEQAAAIILKGREIGVPPMAALAGISVIMGTPTISPQLMLSLIYSCNAFERFDIIESTEECCTVLMKRKGLPAHRETFSIEDARRLKSREDGKTVSLADKYNWRQQPKVMLRWRAISACARLVFPDVLDGLYTHEEKGADVDESGEITRATLEATPLSIAPVVPMREIEAGDGSDETGAVDPRDTTQTEEARRAAYIAEIEARFDLVGGSRDLLDKMVRKRFAIASLAFCSLDQLEQVLQGLEREQAKADARAELLALVEERGGATDLADILAHDFEGRPLAKLSLEELAKVTELFACARPF
jgi:hypothetical protein